MSGNICFVLCDHSTSIDPAQGGALTPAIRGQIAAALSKTLNGDVAPEWGGTFNVRVGASDASDVGAGEVELAVFDHSDQAGAAGYHATDARGKAYGRAFRDDAISLTVGPQALSVILSHEADEMVGDRGANVWADRPDGVTEEALELCDRVEDTTYTVTNDDGSQVECSNFLTRAAFDPGSPGPYDFLGVLTGQMDKTPGGYVILRQTGPMGAPSANGAGPALGKQVVVLGLAARTPAELKRKRHEGSRTRRRGVTFEDDKTPASA
jgi:hypothetical protein